MNNTIFNDDGGYDSNIKMYKCSIKKRTKNSWRSARQTNDSKKENINKMDQSEFQCLKCIILMMLETEMWVCYTFPPNYFFFFTHFFAHFHWLPFTFAYLPEIKWKKYFSRKFCGYFFFRLFHFF